MAEVTQTVAADFIIVGRRRQQTYRFSGRSGDVLTTGLINILSVELEPVATNPPTVTKSGGVVTFTSGGAFTAVGVQVTGN